MSICFSTIIKNNEDTASMYNVLNEALHACECSVVPVCRLDISSCHYFFWWGLSEREGEGEQYKREGRERDEGNYICVGNTLKLGCYYHKH